MDQTITNANDVNIKGTSDASFSVSSSSRCLALSDPLGLFAAKLFAAVLGIFWADLGTIWILVLVALRRIIPLNDPKLLCDIEVISSH